MKKLVFYLYMLITLTACSVYIEASINKFTILKRWNSELSQFNYLILFLSNNDAVSELRQVIAIKNLIDFESNALFLFLDPFQICENKNKFLETAKFLESEARGQRPENIMYLMKYALSRDRYANNIETYLPYFMKYIRCTDNVDIKDIVELIAYPINKIENDVAEVKEKLRLLDYDKNSGSENSVLSAGYELYLKYYSTLEIRIAQYKAEIEEMKKFDDLDDLHAYLLSKYNINCTDSLYEFFYLENFLLQRDFITLNSLKAILEGQQASKIFLFLEHFHDFHTLKELLIKFGYEEVHTYSNEDVEERLNAMNNVFNNVLEAFTSDKRNFEEISKLKNLASIHYSALSIIQSEELLYLMAFELTSDSFTNSYEPSNYLKIVFANLPIANFANISLDNKMEDSNENEKEIEKNY